MPQTSQFIFRVSILPTHFHFQSFPLSLQDTLLATNTFATSDRTFFSQPIHDSSSQLSFEVGRSSVKLESQLLSIGFHLKHLFSAATFSAIRSLPSYHFYHESISTTLPKVH